MCNPETASLAETHILFIRVDIVLLVYSLFNIIKMHKIKFLLEVNIYVIIACIISLSRLTIPNAADSFTKLFTINIVLLIIFTIIIASTHSYIKRSKKETGVV